MTRTQEQIDARYEAAHAKLVAAERAMDAAQTAEELEAAGILLTEAEDELDAASKEVDRFYHPESA